MNIKVSLIVGHLLLFGVTTSALTQNIDNSISSVNVEMNKTSIDDIDARNAVMALNHLHASLNKIVMYNDKIILEEEYNNIINNINLTVIKDREIVDVITYLMDTLTAFRLSEMDKEQFQKEYEHQLDNALTDALSGISVSGLNPIQMATSLVINAGSSYMSYKSQQSNLQHELDKSKWKLKKSELSELNDIRKDFLLTYWQIMKRYSMPDQWRITEKQFERFVNILKDNDNKKKQRQLLRMVDEMSVFPSYWYELSIVSHQNGDKDNEFLALKKYEELNDQLLRHNSLYSLMLANQVSYLDYKTQMHEIKEILQKIHDVDPLNPERKLFLAMQYHMIDDTKKAEQLLNENIDDGFLPVLSQRLKLQLYLKDGKDHLYEDTIKNLITRQNLSATDYLFYLGEKPLPVLIKEINNEVEKINILISKNIYGKDDLIVMLPKKWVYRDIENTDLLIKIDGVEYKFTEISRADDYLSYEYENTVDYDKVLDKTIDQVELKIVHKNLPVVISFDIHILKELNEEKKPSDEVSNNEEALKDENTTDGEENLAKSIGKTIMIGAIGSAESAYGKTKKLYGDYFKTEVKFVPKSITTKNKCFDIQNSLKQCK